MRSLLSTTFFLLAAIAAEAASAGARPNLILILADDHGYGDVSAYERRDVFTPNIDRLAAEGMLFTRMRANCTVCSPTRAAILTGRYADRVGVPGVIRTQPENSWGYFDPSVPTLADHLRQRSDQQRPHLGVVGRGRRSLHR